MKRLVLFALALLPGACHYEFTSPALWAHNSSAAFDAWVFMWFFCILLPVWALVLWEPKQPRPQPHAEEK